MYDRTRKILYGNEQIHNGWFSDFNLSDRSKPGSWNHWLRAPSYQKQKKNLSKPTILTATNDINNQKTMNGEIRVYIYGWGKNTWMTGLSQRVKILKFLVTYLCSNHKIIKILNIIFINFQLGVIFDTFARWEKADNIWASTDVIFKGLVTTLEDLARSIRPNRYGAISYHFPGNHKLNEMVAEQTANTVDYDPVEILIPRGRGKE